MEVFEMAWAKVNLFLTVHGPRDDGFHDLTSLVVQCAFGDRISASWRDGNTDELEITGDPELEASADNLVLQAARVFREHTGEKGRFSFRLEKRIPVGAGLGGGSSDAMAALRAMERVSGRVLTMDERLGLGALLGSDCALFATEHPKIIRGRGELVEDLDPALSARLSGCRLVVFKPPFGISTAWAYRALRKDVDSYIGADVAVARLEAFRRGGPVEHLLVNSFQTVACRKFLALRVALEEAAERFDGAALMSGSGSASFVLPRQGADVEGFRAWIQEQFGPEGFFIETFVL